MVIRRLGILSCGKITGAVYALFGLIIGAGFALVALAGAGFSMASNEHAPGFIGAFLGVGAIIFLPLMYGLFGFVGGLLTALIYNLVAGAVGGLEIDVQ